MKERSTVEILKAAQTTNDPKLQHVWQRDEDDEAVDIFAYNPADPHNGPRCTRCGEGFCHHCEPDCYSYICPAAPSSPQGSRG